MRTLVIIPAYNEQAALPGTLAELRGTHPELDIVVVSDGSTDDTADLARKVGVEVLELPFNLGIGGALRTGFLYAVREGYDAAVQFDADGQHDPNGIADLLAPIAGGANMVVGSRFAESSSHYEVSGARRGAMGLLRVAVQLLAGRTFTDTSSGFRAFDREVLQFFARNYPSEYMESVESLILANLEGFDVVEVPANMRERSAGLPSARRFRLAYHYLRLLLVLGAGFRRKPRPAPRPQPDALSAGDPAPQVHR
ncbi:MAG: glycosyltransferase family 2 protein [Acidimicrobiales bacterium]|nr:glycosyltransferase family 2 protein [Acidimicrobiales bacterium]